MYSISINGNINSYSIKLPLERRKIKIRKVKGNIDKDKISTGPYKYSQVTGKSSPSSR
jgi:hypothetical protein